MSHPFPVLLRVEDVARRLSLSRPEVYRLIRSGRLRAQRLSERTYRVREIDLVDFLESEDHGDKATTATARSRTERASAPAVAAAATAPVAPAPSPCNATGSLVALPSAATAVTPLPPPLPPELQPERATAAVVGPPVPSAETLTIEYLITEWLDDLRGRVRPRTYISYEEMVQRHILPVLGPWRAECLDIRTLEKFLSWKYDSGLSARSVQYIRGLLRQAYNEAIRWGWLTRNVPALARGPRADRPRMDVPSLDEARRLLASFGGIRYGPLFTTVLGLGLRHGEVLGLRWGDVCLPPRDARNQGDLGQVTVRVQLQRIGGVCELVPPKSRTSIRALSLPAFVAEALEKRRDQQRAERLEAQRKWRNEFGLVFTNSLGGPMDESRVRQRFREHLAAHGFEKMRVHDLRHLCASLLLAQGTHPRVLMEILGHSQISLTMDTYAHVMPSAHKEVARAMETAMSLG